MTTPIYNKKKEIKQKNQEKIDCAHMTTPIFEKYISRTKQKNLHSRFTETRAGRNIKHIF